MGPGGFFFARTGSADLPDQPRDQSNSTLYSVASMLRSGPVRYRKLPVQTGPENIWKISGKCQENNWIFFEKNVFSSWYGVPQALEDLDFFEIN